MVLNVKSQIGGDGNFVKGAQSLKSGLCLIREGFATMVPAPIASLSKMIESNNVPTDGVVVINPSSLKLARFRKYP